MYVFLEMISEDMDIFHSSCPCLEFLGPASWYPPVPLCKSHKNSESGITESNCEVKQHVVTSCPMHWKQCKTLELHRHPWLLSKGNNKNTR